MIQVHSVFCDSDESFNFKLSSAATFLSLTRDSIIAILVVLRVVFLIVLFVVIF